MQVISPWGKHPIAIERLLRLIFGVMQSKPCFKYAKSGRARTPVPAESDYVKMRAVAFKIEDKVYEGRAGANHITLYTSLLRDRRVSPDTLDAWIGDEKNHGFVTVKGEFLDRLEVFKRFGAFRSQDLQAKGVFNTAP